MDQASFPQLYQQGFLQGPVQKALGMISFGFETIRFFSLKELKSFERFSFLKPNFLKNRSEIKLIQSTQTVQKMDNKIDPKLIYLQKN